jgi:two-component system, sensor histidine kinase and response regulator
MTETKIPLILAVDDERANLTLLERLLKTHYRVMSVTNGQAALDMLDQAPFDLVLLDIMMPDMDGLQVLQRMRGNPATSDTPVILISALSETQDVTHGLGIGANDYIIKPIDMDVTLARVQTQLVLKQLQDERKRTIAELKAAQEIKNRLLKIASHDLKGPMMNIRMVNLLLRKAADDIPDGEMLLNATDASLEAMHTVIKDFLDTAAMEIGEPDIHPDNVDLAALTHDLMAEHKINAMRKNIMLEISDLSATIYADAARFQQALGNLVSNAIKYTYPDTTVTIWRECDDRNVTIFVADQGAGIPASEQDRLFTQFGKLSTRPTGGEASTGLGLWIVKHLISLQGGETGFECPPEGGSIFWIRMPLANNTSA